MSGSVPSPGPETWHQGGKMSERIVLVVNPRHGVADLHAAWLNAVYTTRTAYSVDEARDALDATVDAILVDERLTSTAAVLDAIEEPGLDCRAVLLWGEEDVPPTEPHEFDERLMRPVSQTDLRETLRRVLQPVPSRGDEHTEAISDTDSTGSVSACSTFETGTEAER